jgi:lipopolysaccharide/colanic/teichoic acid biosynthesis glycosyltransferase
MTTHLPRRRPRDRQHVLGEDLFRHILIGERKRADRLDQPLVVMMLTASDLDGAQTSAIWRQAIEAIFVHIRETDVVGWLERRAAIGIVLHELHSATEAVSRELEARVLRELTRNLDAETVSRFAVRFHVLPRPGAVEEYAVPLQPHFVAPRRTRRRDVFYDRMKRVFDVNVSLTLLLVLAPLFLLIAALVKLKSPGPIFFRQPRVGRSLKPFAMLKFRTMHVNADPKLHHEFMTRFINAGGQNQECGTNGIFKIVDDPRITPIGHVLRKTSLDELPQLWNVLRGEMSLVGPRPPLPYEVQQYKPWHTRRVIEATPGITGLWQVGGRSQTTFEDMVRLDLRYARNRSFWTDIKILLATPGAVVSGKGAC